ncbi:MAG: hypothetical protein Q7S40_17840 [Opitutaceae bacterium]|nr:hypothetical protein [Opitutaceae bacterium]
MKNVFVLTHLLLGAALIAACGAQTVGVLPPGALSLQSCVGVYVAVMTLALAVHDYSGPRRRYAPPPPRPAPQPSKATVSPTADTEPAIVWHRQTFSA